MSRHFASNVCVLMAMGILLVTMWVDRPTRPSKTAASWEVDSFISLDRPLHLVIMGTDIALFLFALAMVVVAWQRG